MGKLIDITGKRYGKLVAIEPCESPRPETTYSGRWWRLRCDCGNTKISNIGTLTGGHVKSCGCARFEAQKYPRKQEGMTYGKLTLLKRKADDKGHRWWLVRCNTCGAEFEVQAKKLSYFRSGCEDCRMLDYEW